MKKGYSYYQSILKGQELPLAYVDLDLFDKNVADILKRSGSKKIRIASKSVRCTTLLQRVLETNHQYQGIMCFTATEAVWLSQQGFDDLLVAYPTFQAKHIAAVAEETKKGKKIYLMVDKEEHLQQIQQVAQQQNTPIAVCLDLDMSSDFSILHFGVWRSSVNSLDTATAFVDSLSKYPMVALKGLMGYEAQIAGVGDAVKGQGLKNNIIRLLKRRSIREIAARRAAVTKMILEKVGPLDFVNGGGTGSLETTKLEEAVTEVTVGSGFYSPLLFDGYNNFQHEPAAGFAIEVVRQPQKQIYTCLGGGYVASGMAGVDKIPQPYLPEGCRLNPNEMAGEVQTPIHYKGTALSIGQPVLMRHSKAGELCERFQEIVLIKNNKIEDKALTYRGAGQCFL
jgi:D-serine deaminase-like pyridoxal phosphate-dependent protein